MANLNRRMALGTAVTAGIAAFGGMTARGAAAEKKAHPPSTFDVKEFGAFGDGSADDAEALQTAIDAAVSAGGGSVVMPPGVYRLTRTITLGDGVDLAGFGSVSILKPDFPLPRNRVIDNDWLTGNSNISLRNFKLDRSGANVQHGILLNGVTNLLIDGVEVAGYPSSRSGCISISGVGQDRRLISRNLRVVNCILADSANFGLHFGFVDGGVMANNTALNADREVFGVEPDPGVSATNVVISGNTILGTASVDGTETGLIIVTTTSGGVVDGVTVTGNVLRQPSPSGTANPGIHVLGATAVNLTGNVVHDMDGPGIQVSGTNGVVVAANTVNNCGRKGDIPGIRLHNATHCSVTANYVSGVSHSYGIEEDAGASNNLICSNFLRDLRPIGPVGSGTVAFGNKSNESGSATTLGSSFAINRREVAGDYTVGLSDYLIAVVETSSPISINLPPAESAPVGTVFIIKDEFGKAEANNITVRPAGTDTIDSVGAVALDTRFASVHLYCAGPSRGWARL